MSDMSRLKEIVVENDWDWGYSAYVRGFGDSSWIKFDVPGQRVKIMVPPASNAARDWVALELATNKSPMLLAGQEKCFRTLVDPKEFPRVTLGGLFSSGGWITRCPF